ncbi:MAG TPA: hypothetical protein VKN73_05800 [Desulfosalsimonadaceae bacterium]|nr:hypothetical protein [Desulfosalsimonadaceae bacterium]
MSIQPEGEDLRKAIKWISEMRQEEPDKSLSRLVEEAGAKFDLPPKDQEFLYRFIKQNES